MGEGEVESDVAAVDAVVVVVVEFAVAVEDDDSLEG